MPIRHNGIQISDPQKCIPLFLSDASLKDKAAQFQSQPVESVPEQGTLYVNQSELAVVSPEDVISIVGTDDATTCHIMVLRHTGSGVVGVGHFDGSDMKTGMLKIIDKVKKLSIGKPDGRLDLHLFGGFTDDRGESQKISEEILGLLANCADDLHIQNAAILGFNDTIKEEEHFPIIYGIGVEVKTGRIFPAEFGSKGPDRDIRAACSFTGFFQMRDIYENQEKHLVVGPFDWKPLKDIDTYVSLPDCVIRMYMSTSPKQEPAYFESHVRDSLKIIQEHPNPSKTLFPDNKPRLYKMDNDQRWVKCN